MVQLAIPMVRDTRTWRNSAPARPVKTRRKKGEGKEKEREREREREREKGRLADDRFDQQSRLVGGTRIQF